jgi:hypothetical protein
MTYRLIIVLIPVLVCAQHDITELKRGVVKIVAHKPNNVTDTGAGIITGLDGATALIATVRHLLAGAQKIEVVFFEKQYSEFPARTFRRFDEDLDIGLVLAEIPADLAANIAQRFPTGDPADLREGDRITIIGHPLNREWQATLNTNTIAGVSDSGDLRKFRFTKTALERGNSGGPIFNADGALIGLVTRLDPIHGVAVKIDALLAVLRQEWGIATWWRTEDARQDLARELAAHAVAARNEVEKRAPDEQNHFWWSLLKRNDRQALVERSVLLALESVKRKRTPEGERALRDGLAWLIRPLFRLKHDSDVRALEYSPNGQYIAAVSRNTARVWDARTGNELTRLRHEADTAIAWSPDGGRLATGWGDLATVRQVPGGAVVAQAKHPHIPSRIAFSPDGKLLGVASSTHTDVHLSDAASGRLVSTLRHPFPVRLIEFSKDGKYLAVAIGDRRRLAESNTAWVWEVASGQQAGRVAHEQPVTTVAFSEDGKYLATADEEGLLKIWNAATRAPIADLKAGAEVSQIKFSPDGRQLFAAPESAGAVIWDVASWRKLRTVGQGSINEILLSPQRMLVGADGKDAAMHVWDAETGAEIGRLIHIEFPGPVAFTVVWFSPDGAYAATVGAYNETVAVWRLLVEDPISDACERLARNLTPDEWRRYLGREPYRRTCANVP